MRYEEIFESYSGYYHYSKTPLEVGTVIIPRGNFTINNEIQELLEKYRPANFAPRNKVVYMMKNPTDYMHYGIDARNGDGYLYKVRPTKPINKHDASNIGYLQKAYRMFQANGPQKYLWENEDLKKEVALAYWNGEPNRYYTKAQRLWEYTAPTATVISSVII